MAGRSMTPHSGQRSGPLGQVLLPQMGTGSMASPFSAALRAARPSLTASNGDAIDRRYHEY